MSEELRKQFEKEMGLDSRARDLKPYHEAYIEWLEARLRKVEEELPKIKPEHYNCEGDTWFGCPKSTDGCANEAEGDECNCGADEAIKIYEHILSLATGKD